MSVDYQCVVKFCQLHIHFIWCQLIIHILLQRYFQVPDILTLWSDILIIQYCEVTFKVISQFCGMIFWFCNLWSDIVILWYCQGKVIYESLVTCEWVEEVLPGKPLIISIIIIINILILIMIINIIIIMIIINNIILITGRPPSPLSRSNGASSWPNACWALQQGKNILTFYKTYLYSKLSCY